VSASAREVVNAVRAMLLTSTRAVPGSLLDAWSDHDVILVVRDIPRTSPTEVGPVTSAADQARPRLVDPNRRWGKG